MWQCWIGFIVKYCILLQFLQEGLLLRQGEETQGGAVGLTDFAESMSYYFC